MSIHFRATGFSPGRSGGENTIRGEVVPWGGEERVGEGGVDRGFRREVGLRVFDCVPVRCLNLGQFQIAKELRELAGQGRAQEMLIRVRTADISENIGTDFLVLDSLRHGLPATVSRP